MSAGGAAAGALSRRRSGRLAGLAALALCLATLAPYWPGYVTYDTIIQYGQLLSGQVDDWHPPVMVRLWALLGGKALGTAPMFLLQMGLYWLGLGLIAVRLVQGGRSAAAGAVLALGLLPPVLAWQVVILKDGQMTGAMISAAGIAGWWRLAGRPIPWPAWGAIGVLLVYATLLRANGAFAAIPLGVMLAGWPRNTAGRVLASLLLIGAALAVSPLVNHRLLGAEDSGVSRTLPLFDIAGIAARVPGRSVAGLAPDAGAGLEAAGCVTPLNWDQLGRDHCAPFIAPLDDMDAGQLDRLLAAAALAHPLAYAAHRLAHLNSTERWLVPPGWPSARTISLNQPNDLKLVAPGTAATWLQRLVTIVDESPIGWPFVYTALLLIALPRMAGARPSDARSLALAIAVSGLALEASFAPVSVASDLRYHMWPMLAAGLALALPPARSVRPAGPVAMGLLIVLIAAGIGARLVLHMPPPAMSAPAATVPAPPR